ncbi:DUF2304 domain-containing protein [Luminiphilus sp.]|nr:DUF2304 domain-containing protein [Luminiphilus sp.]MDA9711261.1 DUF2304 domain-containing protein [Luminiphilus sp.]
MIPVITSIIGVTVSALILLLIRRDQLEASVGVAWILVAAGFCLLGFAPFFVDSLASLLNVAHAPSLAFSLALGAVTLKLVYDDVQRSKAQITSKRLVQRLAILETRLRELEGSAESDLKKEINDQDGKA